MSDPEENRELRTSDDTIIRKSDPEDDTIIAADIDSTVVESVEVEHTSIVTDSTVVEADDTVINSDETVLPSNTTDAYGTLIGALMDTSAAINLEAELIDDGMDALSEEPRLTSAIALRHVNGETYSLVNPIIFGRLPVAPRSAKDHVQLVVLASPEGLVSSTHARVEQLGSLVVVTDLGSTNGTRITIEGKDSRLLGPGDSLTLPDRAIIDLGDGNRLEVLG